MPSSKGPSSEALLAHEHAPREGHVPTGADVEAIISAGEGAHCAKLGSAIPKRRPAQHGSALLAVSVALSMLTACLLVLGLSRGGGVWLPRDPAGLLVYPDCVMGLGGGPASRGGAFSHFKYPDVCKAQLDQYFEAENGIYYQQVRKVSTAAISFVQNLSRTVKPTLDQVFVFDIDETALSNAVEWAAPRHHRGQRGPWQLASWALVGGSRGQMSSVEEQANATGVLLQRRQEMGDLAMVEGDERPPLIAVRDLYWFLLEHNYSVAFITGRRESARAWTAHNLLTAGYGDLCPEPASARAQQDAKVGKRTAPCYVALHLREEDDDRPASVYKPERRKALEDAGYTVVGSIGDQFSDLEGLHQGGSSWKLPNPVYLIL